jgi:outer membrane lipoprotein LolB
MRSALGALVVAMACAMLSGCAALLRDTEQATARPARASIREFAVDARISVTRAAERAQAGIAWQHSAGPTDEIDVFSPVGSQIARLTVSPGGAQLDTAQQERVVAANAEELSARIFGASLPLNGMADWVLGRAAGQSVSVEHDSLGRFSYLAEAGWVVRYLDYESDAATALPRTVEFERGDLRVRLRIDAWRDIK